MHTTECARRAWRRFLAVMVTLAVMISLPAVLAPRAMAVTQAQIDALRDDADELDKQKEQLEAQLDAIAQDRSQAMEQKVLLEQQIDVLSTKIRNMDQQIAQYDQLIAQKEEELAQAEQDEAEQYELFCQRVRYMEERGQVSYWSVLFNSASFSDLLDNVIMINEIMEYDNAVMEQLIAIREQIQQDKAELEQARSEQQAARDEQAAARSEVEQDMAQVDALIAQINSQANEVEHAKDELEAQAAAMDREIAELERQLAASGTTIVSESGYLWPLTGYTNLSSLYAGRIDPFTGRPATHSGIDIPAPRGTPIKASKSGVVITSAYNSGGYGQYVVISHGDGDSTLYAHMVQNSQTVSVGDTVSQGQVIGQVGTTGRSTGYHLHFEIRENGSRIDPVNRFSGLTYGGSPL